MGLKWRQLACLKIGFPEDADGWSRTNVHGSSCEETTCLTEEKRECLQVTLRIGVTISFPSQPRGKAPNCVVDEWQYS
jgi:hypothetical protein